MGAEEPSSTSRHPRERANGARRSLARLALFLPFLLLPFGTRALADATARNIGSSLALTLEHLLDFRDASAPAEPVAAPLDLDTPWIQNIDVLTPTPPAPAGRGLSGKGLSGPRGGILVRASVVAAAVESGARPSGVAVPAQGFRPAGIALAGVSGFGAGLRDGDVLTRVGGTPATSVGAVIGAVAGALRQKARVITGEIWRGEQRLSIAVEIPRRVRLRRDD